MQGLFQDELLSDYLNLEDELDRFLSSPHQQHFTLSLEEKDLFLQENIIIHDEETESLPSSPRSPSPVSSPSSSMDSPLSSPEQNHSASKTTCSGKPRLTWTPELHRQFEASVEALGRAATAKTVMNLMVKAGLGDVGLTRVRVANHLQYYKTKGKKGKSKHPMKVAVNV
ncbi:putative two-component response regulator ARR20 [Planoprotostelium fungivorum]|uniref:Putative two-component response regulator ARR20 n=1 Tax=Planoprotostelium fungivorum TaxID=1890364 RepID=A0A2P6N345_9EUKA|nr:putative two-component response regulator ARR20 [Planoprotostelium fungivorum]